MKKLSVLFILSVFVLSGCANINITFNNKHIGTKNTGGDYDVDSIKTVRLNGAIYCETGDDTDDLYGDKNIYLTEADGTIEKTAKKYELPQGDGESNFFCPKGYRIGRQEDTIEVFDDDDLEIFKKVCADEKVLAYKYCYVLEGDMPNGGDMDILVIANDRNITFDEAYQSLVTSMNVKKDMVVFELN